MPDFNPLSIIILGRQPAIGIAELESLYGSTRLKRLNQAALLDIPAEEINYKRLGSAVKVGRVLSTLETNDWPSVEKYLRQVIPTHLPEAEKNKFTLGISVYGLDVSPETLQKSLINLKKLIKKAGRPVRVIPNKTLELSSAQVIHNKLNYRGAWELLLVKHGKQTILGQTLFVQDFEDYAARDQKRPMRDSFVGMLPPKLAQIIINLAVGQVGNGKWEIGNGGAAKNSHFPIPTSQSLTILDPFCGTGVIPQETLLMGYDIVGTDLSDKMVNYSRQNIEWLKQSWPAASGKADISVGDALKTVWPKTIDCVATEMYLGPPLKNQVSEERLKPIIKEVDELLEKFLRNIGGQLKPGTRLCLAIPAWRLDRETRHLPILDHLGDLSYNRLSFVHVVTDELIYFRPEQAVARELLVLIKK